MGILGIPTIKETFSIEIPEGILLYPQCGRDTYKPLALFIDSIRTFRFSDIRGVELPLLQCRKIKNNEYIKKERVVRGDDLSTGFISSQIVGKVEDEGSKNKIYDITHDFMKYFNVDVGAFFIKDNCKKQTWTLDLEGDRRIEVFTHSMDILGSILKFENIAVFYHRTMIKGGNGAIEIDLKPDLLKIILDKLKVGGILLSDRKDILDRRLEYIGNYVIGANYLYLWKLIK